MSLRVQVLVLVFFMVLIYPICVPLARDRPKSFCAWLPRWGGGSPNFTRDSHTFQVEMM